MGGGIIEIVNYGSQDLYLTGAPEITFFKLVYRRYSNFAIDSKKVNFDDPVSFGSTNRVIVPKSGDLINKMYLEVILPAISLEREINVNNLINSNIEEEYNLIQEFFELNRAAFLAAHDIYISENSRCMKIMRKNIKKIYSKSIKLLNEVGPIINKNYNFKDLNILDILEEEEEENLDILYNKIKSAFDKSTNINKFYFENLRDIQEFNLDQLNKNIKFAWVDRVGHAIIEYIEVLIDGDRIERHYGDWINIWYELTSNKKSEDIYFELIGNVPILTNFDRVAKPQYKLRIPLIFWFCRYTGCSFPLVSLEHNDFTVQVKFRNLPDVSYIESNSKIYLPDRSTTIYLDEVVNNLNVNITACLYIDYVYLDTPERRRFAQSSHEYLIDQVQVMDFSTQSGSSKVNCLLDNFYNPCKELVWVSQKRKYTQITESGNFTNKLRWDNYSLTDYNIGNPIKYSSLQFNGETRVLKLDSSYFNYLQPEKHHSRTPSDGINVYSFALHPEESQPSSSANLSRLSRVQLTLEFDPDEEDRDIRVYSRSINILRFISGLGTLAFPYDG